MVVALNMLNSVGTDGSFGNQESDKSVLSAFGQTITPLFTPMGIEEDNWPATVGIFTGVLAKEAVVGTLDSIYTQIAAEESGGLEGEGPFEFWPTVQEAFATIPDNLAGVSELLLDPLGLDVGEISDPQAAAEEQDVSSGIFGAMASRFDGQAGAFAYLLFILLYFPCVATIGAIARETGGRWAGFVAAWTTGVAYTTATIFYQAATFSSHPASSTLWIALFGTLIVGVIFGLRIWGRKGGASGYQGKGAEA
jgi:ferrous iron transport protein B